MELECRLPPPLSDADIDALLDGTPTARQQAHLAACPACAARYQQALVFETRLHQQLQRALCPSAAQLADLEMQLLPADEQQRLSAHVAQCRHCQADLQMFRQFMADRSLPNAPRPAPRPLPAARYAEQIAFIQAPSTALRGKAAGPIMATTANGITLFLELHTEPTSGRVLVGQLVTQKIEDGEAWVNALVQVFQSERLIGTAFINEMGEFRCPLVETTPVMLRIQTENQAALVIEQAQFEA